MYDHYTPEFFAARAARANRDAMLLVPEMRLTLGSVPETVIDIGCGDGSMLRWWGEMGTRGLVGVDAHGPPGWTALHGGLHLPLDVTQPIDLHMRGDLVVCLEVAEHLPESAADTLVDTLCRHGDRILFSAAPPGQGGTDHLNEQPWSYWEEKLARRGYITQDIIRHRLPAEVSPWYRANTRLICKPEKAIRVPRTKVCTARYRDCLRDVEDAISELTKGPFLSSVYGVPPFAKHELAWDAMVSKMRSELASETIGSPTWSEFEYTLWIDADQAFLPQQAVDLVVACDAGGYDILTALYVTKERKPRIVHRSDGEPRPVALGPYAQPYQVDGCGFGFVVTRNDVFRRVVSDPRSKVERVWHGAGRYYWDLFRPTNAEPRPDWIDLETGMACGPSWNEDVAFCEKAKACGIDVWVASNIAVGHVGRYTYSVMDMDLSASPGGAS